MKTRHLLAAGFAASVLAIAVAPAHASDVSWDSLQGNLGNTYAGSYIAAPMTGFTFGTGLNDLSVGAFTHSWIFDITPDTGAEFSLSFTPFRLTTGITNFTGNLFTTSAFTCITVSSSCSVAGTIDTLVIPGVTSNQFSEGFSFLIPSGRYALQVSGNITDAVAKYTGEMTFEAPVNQVPEPDSLALLGLGLAGLAAATRRKKKQA